MRINNSDPIDCDPIDYDNAYRVTSAEQPNSFGNKTFQYDDNGNRTELTEEVSNQTSTYEYNGNHELISIEQLIEGQSPVNVSYDYDNNGALITETQGNTQTKTYDYNSFARIQSFNENNVNLATYQYDAQSRRISKTFNGQTTYFLYDDSGSGLVGEYNQQGDLIRGYSYGLGNTFTTNPVAQKVPANNGNSIEYEFSYYQNDHLGTPQRLINSAGATTWSADYDVFGEAQEQFLVNQNPLRFPGQYYDQETGLHYNWNRYYDPRSGRYVTSDPIGLGGGLNTYGYVMGSPLRFTDPTGEVVPALVACALNPVCASAVRAGVGALIGGLSALAAAVNDPCFNGDLVDVAGSGALVGGLSSFVPGAGGLAGATLRGGLAGAGGNAVGQLFVNGGTNNFNITQTSVAGVVGAISLAGGNVVGFNAALHAARGGAGSAQALAIGESTGSAVGTVVGASATLAEIGLNRNNGECGCSNP